MKQKKYQKGMKNDLTISRVEAERAIGATALKELVDSGKLTKYKSGPKKQHRVWFSRKEFEQVIFDLNSFAHADR